MRIREYKKEDRESVRRICAETGFVGSPITEVFCDKELWSDALTSYYTDWEPESIFVLEDFKGRVVGYILGCMDSRMELIYLRSLALKFVAKLLSKYFFGGYDKKSKRFARYLLFHSRTEIPKSPKHYAHFHINLLDPYRNVKNGSRMMRKFFLHLKDNNIKGVYCQTFDYEGSRTVNFFKKFGMQELDRKKNNMWKGFIKGNIDLVTLVYEFKDHMNFVEKFLKG